MKNGPESPAGLSFERITEALRVHPTRESRTLPKRILIQILHPFAGSRGAGAARGPSVRARFRFAGSGHARIHRMDRCSPLPVCPVARAPAGLASFSRSARAARHAGRGGSQRLRSPQIQQDARQVLQSLPPNGSPLDVMQADFYYVKSRIGFVQDEPLSAPFQSRLSFMLSKS